MKLCKRNNKVADLRITRFYRFGGTNIIYNPKVRLSDHGEVLWRCKSSWNAGGSSRLKGTYAYSSAALMHGVHLPFHSSVSFFAELVSFIESIASSCINLKKGIALFCSPAGLSCFSTGQLPKSNVVLLLAILLPCVWLAPSLFLLLTRWIFFSLIYYGPFIIFCLSASVCFHAPVSPSVTASPAPLRPCTWGLANWFAPSFFTFFTLFFCYCETVTPSTFLFRIP